MATTTQDTITANPKTLRPCKNPASKIDKTFKEPLEAKIVKHRLEGWLYIHCPAIHPLLDLRVCNLPLEACEEGLTVVITGNV